MFLIPHRWSTMLTTSQLMWINDIFTVIVFLSHKNPTAFSRTCNFFFGSIFWGVTTKIWLPRRTVCFGFVYVYLRHGRPISFTQKRHENSLFNFLIVAADCFRKLIIRIFYISYSETACLHCSFLPNSFHSSLILSRKSST